MGLVSAGSGENLSAKPGRPARFRTNTDLHFSGSSFKPFPDTLGCENLIRLRSPG
jgi:hypothetical protein